MNTFLNYFYTSKDHVLLRTSGQLFALPASFSLCVAALAGRGEETLETGFLPVLPLPGLLREVAGDVDEDITPPVVVCLPFVVCRALVGGFSF